MKNLKKLKGVPDPADITGLPHASLDHPLLVGSEPSMYELCIW